MKNLSFKLFIGILCFAPLAFGTVEQWSIALVEGAVFCTVLVHYLQDWRRGEDNLQIPGLLPLILLIGWISLQLLPLPYQLVKLISPSSWEVYRPVITLTDQSQWIPLTVDKKSTVAELLRVSTSIFFYIITIQILSHGEQLQKTIKWICILTICLAFLSILMKLTSPDSIYWFRSVPVNAKPYGTWVNRNQYSGFMTMLSPLVIALFYYFKPTVSYKETLRNRFVSFFTLPESNLHLFFGFGAIIISSSVFLSLSRGGIITLCLSTLCFFFLLSIKKKQYSVLPATIIIGCLILAVTWFGWQPIIERFDRIVDDAGDITLKRFAIWQDSIQIIKDFPVFGSGFGSYESIYPMYRTVSGVATINHAHNDYLEFLTDGGVIGFVLAGWFIVSIIIHGWKMLARRRDSFALHGTVGALSGLIAALIFGVTDFNLHNGADGLYFFFLCGLLVSTSNTRLHYRTKPSYLAEGTVNQKKTILISAVIFFFAIALYQGGVMSAKYKYAEVEDIYLNKLLKKQKFDKVARITGTAMNLDPLEGLYPAILGDIERYRNNPKRALEYYISAARNEPMNSFYLQQIGLLLSVSDRQLAGTFMQQSHIRSAKRDAYVLSWVEWLLWNNERERAIEVLKEAYLINPRLAIISYPLLHGFSFTRSDTELLLPSSVEVWVKYGLFLNELGDVENGEYYLNRSLDFLNEDMNVSAGVFISLYRYYKKRKQSDKAIEVIRRGIQKIPEIATFHALLGDYYLEKGIIYRAEDEYQQALMLNPRERDVRRKMESLEKKKSER